mmetsp:Transcript_10021/g.9949  ORF Transcript_10021/g.9949 Transcript_10021/m.9949 type:complete len:101 (+) Transcript_10021:34-336(+)
MLSSFRRITPLLNRVMIKRQEVPNKSAGGILLPETKERDMQIGEVIAIGPGSYDEQGNFQEIAVKVGQKVLLPPYGGTSVDFKDEKYSIYKDSEILAVLE